jgi:hypothetical protein
MARPISKEEECIKWSLCQVYQRFLLSIDAKCFFLNVLFYSLPIGYIHFINLLYSLWSRDSSVRLTTGYGLDQQEVGVRVPVGFKIVSPPC